MSLRFEVRHARFCVFYVHAHVLYVDILAYVRAYAYNIPRYLIVWFVVNYQQNRRPSQQADGIKQKFEEAWSVCILYA